MWVKVSASGSPLDAARPFVDLLPFPSRDTKHPNRANAVTSKNDSNPVLPGGIHGGCDLRCALIQDQRKHALARLRCVYLGYLMVNGRKTRFGLVYARIYPAYSHGAGSIVVRLERRQAAREISEDGWCVFAVHASDISRLGRPSIQCKLTNLEAWFGNKTPILSLSSLRL